jgi:hypothetical protein
MIRRFRQQVGDMKSLLTKRFDLGYSSHTQTLNLCGLIDCWQALDSTESPTNCGQEQSAGMISS